MDYYDRFSIEREGRRLRSEELRRLENAAIDWLHQRFHSLRAWIASAFHHPHSA